MVPLDVKGNSVGKAYRSTPALVAGTHCSAALFPYRYVLHASKHGVDTGLPDTGDF